MSTAYIVGSGPNGLACGAVLARAGVDVTVLEAAETIGGGTRSSELTLPGLMHDHCSAVHPMAVASPVFRELGLEQHGLEWCWPEIDLAHPLEGGRAGVMFRSLEQTAAGLGADGDPWKRLFERPARAFPKLNDDIVQPVIHLPRHPLSLARFGVPALFPASTLVKGFETEEAKALFGGVAAHSFSPLNQVMSSAVGMALVAAGHSEGWPVAKGGSRAITDALAAVILAEGGRIETGRPVESLDDLPSVDAVVLDLSPRGVIDVAGERLPESSRRAYARYRYGPGSFKLDLAIEGGIPWANEACRRAGTVHVGGDFAEIALAESEINDGRMPEKPFLLVGQQYLADPSRSRGDIHPIWAYAHVPNGYPGDASEAILDQIERFAPGTRERIVGRASRSALEFAAYNRNFIGGDIANGANSPRQLIARPRLALDPYRTGAEGVWICSAATPPGGGVHGMGGANAARSVLKAISS
jgi:phytoene dehydrogenase-like protein